MSFLFPTPPEVAALPSVGPSTGAAEASEAAAAERRRTRRARGLGDQFATGSRRGVLEEAETSQPKLKSLLGE